MVNESRPKRIIERLVKELLEEGSKDDLYWLSRKCLVTFYRTELKLLKRYNKMFTEIEKRGEADERR